MSPLICLDCVQLPVFQSPQSSPCWGDLPCLLTDNSDRKLLHVITLLKSQFTQPQQIILRWVPGVMETVFSTLRPAPLLLCQSYTKCLSVEVVKKKHFLSSFLSPPQQPSSHPSFLATFFISLILPSFCPSRSPLFSNQKDSSVSPQADIVCR